MQITILVLLCAFVLCNVLLVAQQRQIPARSGTRYTGRIIFQNQTQLYLDIGPCGGTIVTFRQPYNLPSKAVGTFNCQGRQVNLFSVKQN
jgi:hypothetical protein